MNIKDAKNYFNVRGKSCNSCIYLARKRIKKPDRKSFKVCWVCTYQYKKDEKHCSNEQQLIAFNY